MGCSSCGQRYRPSQRSQERVAAAKKAKAASRQAPPEKAEVVTPGVTLDSSTGDLAAPSEPLNSEGT